MLLPFLLADIFPVAAEARDGSQSEGHSSVSSTGSFEQRLIKLVAGGYAPATIHKYNSIWMKFAQFLNGFDPKWSFPIPVTTLAAYAVKLHEEGTSPGTIRTHLAGIGWRHKLRGFPDPS